MASRSASSSKHGTASGTSSTNASRILSIAKSDSSSKLSQIERIQDDSSASSISDAEVDQDEPDSDSHIASEESVVNIEDSSSQVRARGHKLPSGWAHEYDPETDEYRNDIIQADQLSQDLHILDLRRTDKSAESPTRDHEMQTSRRPTFHLFDCEYGYHFPSSPTASMLSELAIQVNKPPSVGPAASKSRLIGYGKSKLVVPSDEEEQRRRLHDMFPTATEPVIDQMIRIYHKREGLIKAALISLGYKRSSEYDARQASAQSPVMLMMSRPSSKKLFDKLVGYFPDKDESLIKNLMYKHKEVEHEVISALVESGDDGSKYHKLNTSETTASTTRNGAIMKLRYLKVLYPTCEEIDLYHLLHCNDLNVQRVMEIVDKRGHKQANIDEVLKNRRSQTQKMRAQQAAHAAKEKSPSVAHDLVEAHKKRVKPSMAANRIEGLKESLQKNYEHLGGRLILAALEAADYNEGLARKFLDEMEPIEDSKFMHRYKLPLEHEPNVVAYPCKAIQKGDTNFMSIISNEFVLIDRDVVECKHALALLKVDASTYTGDDFPKIKTRNMLGPRVGLRLGSQHLQLRQQRKIEHENNRKIEHISLRTGSSYKQICDEPTRIKPNSLASGSKKALIAHGSNCLLQKGHNSALLHRTHPFFCATAES